MDLNNITAEQQKGLEFLKVRFQSELDDIKSKIVQLNKPFPDDLTTHLQNSFLNKELLFSPSQQIGLKKDQRKDQLEKLKGDENERQYLGRIKLSLERFAEAGMRQDLENKLLGIVQNSKLTSNKRMSAFFCLMHSLGFGFKRTSDFVQWAFGQMWVYENRRIAKDRKSKMKKTKEGQSATSSKPDKKSKHETQSDNQDDSDQQQQEMQDNKETMQKIEANNMDINGQNFGQESNQLKQQGLDGDMLPKFNLSQGQAANSDLSLQNNMNMFNNQHLNLNEQDLQNQQINGDKKDGNSSEILQAQLNLHQIIQVKLNTKIKQLEEQNEEKALQIQQLLNLCENSKTAFQGFLINLFPLLQNLNVSPEIVSQVQNLARQHQYVNANRRVGDPSSIDPELQNIIGGNKRNNTNNQNNIDILGQGFMDMNKQTNKFETKVEHINQNNQNQDDRLNNSNHLSSQHIPQNQQQSFNQFNQQQVNQQQQNNQQHTQQQHLQQNQQQLTGIGNGNQFQLLGQNNFSTSLNTPLQTFGNQNLLMQNNFSNTLPMQNNFGLHGQDLNLGNQFNQDLLTQQQVLQNHQDGLK